MNKIISVFAGNDCNGSNATFYKSMAYDLGKKITEAGFTLATGAGDGLMEEASRGAYEAGGKVIGVGLNFENRKLSKHVTEYEVFEKLSPRQDKLIAIGDAYIALPGGTGTFYEILNIIALKRLGEIKTNKPLVLVGEYFKPFIAMLTAMASEGFTTESVHSLYATTSSPDEAMEIVKQLFTKNNFNS